ncbi:MAG TPA: phosphatase PAP2 family protein [Candidatus Paceibacterota bacterium]
MLYYKIMAFIREIVLLVLDNIISGGGMFLILFFLVFFIYVIARVFFFFAGSFLGEKSARQNATTLLASGAATFVILLCIFFVGGVVVKKLDSAPTKDEVIRVSNQLMEIDRRVFGIYPPLWIHSRANFLKPAFDRASSLIISSYTMLGIVIGFVWLSALMADVAIFYRMATAFFLSFILSIPFWYMIPAISPFELYTENVLGVEPSHRVASALETFDPNTETRAVFDRLRHMNKSGENNSFGITTIPSMHIAWATVVVYFGIMLYSPAAFILIPYYLFNAVGTVYLLQHYAVDIPAGMLIAGVAIAISSYISKTAPRSIVAIHNVIREDIRTMKNFLQRFLPR